MRKFAALLFFVSFAIIGFAQVNKESDLAIMNLRGNVKYIEESTYYPQSKVITQDSVYYKPPYRTYFLIKFNKDGNIDHAIIKDIFFINGSKVRTQQYVYKYDEKGALFEKMYSFKDVFDINYKYTYDEKGNLMRKASFYKDNSPGQYDYYKYDAKGNQIEMSSFYEDGKLLYRKTYEYDTKGNVIRENSFGPYNELNSYSEYKYNDKGNKIEKNYFSKDGILDERTSYKYDKQENLIEEKIFKSNGDLKDIRTYQYTYDMNNNWIEKKSLSKSNSVFETEVRKIVYYGDKDENNYPSWDDLNYLAEDIILNVEK